MLLLVTTNPELSPDTPLLSTATPGPGLLIMLLFLMVTSWLLPSKRNDPLYQSAAPDAVLPAIVTPVVLKNSSDLPLFVKVLLVTRMFDCLPAVCASKATADSSPVVPLPPRLFRNWLESMVTLVRFPPERPPSV